jgi:hypothetical protein
MSKIDDKEKDDSVKWSLSGNEDEWDGFDRRITRWMRKKYDSIGEKIWNGDVPDIEYLSDDDLLTHCTEVLDCIKVNNITLGKTLKKEKEFWTREWQMIWMARQATLMIDYIEEHARGQAENEVVN